MLCGNEYHALQTNNPWLGKVVRKSDQKNDGRESEGVRLDFLKSIVVIYWPVFSGSPEPLIPSEK